MESENEKTETPNENENKQKRFLSFTLVSFSYFVKLLGQQTNSAPLSLAR